MRGLSKLLLLLAIVTLIPACATTPQFDTSQVDKSLTPAAVSAAKDAAQGRKVQWGGVIIASDNLPQVTRLEVLAYPLSGRGRPDRDGKVLGRFLLEHPGYLETADYAPGRMVTVIGPISRVEEGVIGEASYRYPVVRAEQLHLWPKHREENDPRIHFGIGIGLGL